MSTDPKPRKKILLVDDYRDFVLAARIFLEGEGYEVVEAYDGEQALDLLKQVRPDLIILDVMMPRLDGWQTLALIQGDERLRDIPVMMLTALSEGPNIQMGIDLGCIWYYTKPITDYPDLALVIGRITSGLEAPPPLEE